MKHHYRDVVELRCACREFVDRLEYAVDHVRRRLRTRAPDDIEETLAPKLLACLVSGVSHTVREQPKTISRLDGNRRLLVRQSRGQKAERRTSRTQSNYRAIGFGEQAVDVSGADEAAEAGTCIDVEQGRRDVSFGGRRRV